MFDPPSSPSWPSHTSDSSLEQEYPDLHLDDRSSSHDEEIPEQPQHITPTNVQLSSSAQHNTFAPLLYTFLSQLFTRMPTCADRLHCGADALRLVLSARFPFEPISKAEVVNTITNMVTPLDDFRVHSIDNLVPQHGNFDLVLRPDANFCVDQLASAAAILGADRGVPELVLGVVKSESPSVPKVQIHDYRVDRSADRQIEAVWVWHCNQHWEALVPRAHDGADEAAGSEVLKFVLDGVRHMW